MSEPNETDAPPAGPPSGDTTAPLRLRAEPPRVTRLSRKVLAGLGLVAGIVITHPYLEA